MFVFVDACDKTLKLIGSALDQKIEQKNNYRNLPGKRPL